MASRREKTVWVIYSPNEESLGDGAGYWSNDLGWVPRDQATEFTVEELLRFSELPKSTGQDARTVQSVVHRHATRGVA